MKSGKSEIFIGSRKKSPGNTPRRGVYFRGEHLIGRYRPAIVRWISPVEVVILQIPPDSVAGTLTEPAEVLVTNIFSVRSVPVTFPVEVLTLILPASQPSKRTEPVFLLISKLSAATVFFMLMLPVLPEEVSARQVVSAIVVFPVETAMERASRHSTALMKMSPVVTDRLTVSAVTLSSRISPVLTLTESDPSTDAPKDTSPVLPLISALPKASPDGTEKFPVLLPDEKDSYLPEGI